MNPLQSFSVLPPGYGEVTIAEIQAEFVHVRSEEITSMKVPSGLSQEWIGAVSEPRGLQLQGSGFDVFLKGSFTSMRESLVQALNALVATIKGSPVGISLLRSPAEAIGGESKSSFHCIDDRVAISSAVDDAIHILNVPAGKKPFWERPALKSNKMQNIRALQFRPFTGSTIAAACERGVAVWRRRDVTYLVRARHAPVSSVQWSPNGTFLASASPNDRSVLIWDVGLKQASPVMEIRSGSRIVSWSPMDGRYLLATGAREATFRIVETASWSSSKWANMLGAISSCCWSSDGSTVLLSSQEEEAIHAIRFDSDVWSPIGPASHSHLVHSELTTSVQLPCGKPCPAGNDSVLVGGTATSMAWDPTSERLAVVFTSKDASSPGNELVAIYSTRLRPTFRMTAIGWARGPPNSGRPVALAFKPRFDKGALLS